MTGLALELRRGPGRWLVLPLAVLGIWLVRQALTPGPAVWPLVVSALGTSASVMAPVAAGVAAFAGTRSRRRATDVLERLATRGAAAAGLAELGALLVWVLAAFLLVLAGVYVPAALTATWSGPDLLRTLAIGGGLLLEVVVGYVVGRVVPRRLTPPLVAIASYGLVVANTSSRRGFGWSLLLPVNLQLSDEFDRINHAAAVGQLLWYAGVAVLVVASWALRRQGRTPTPVAALVAGILVAAVGLAVLLPQHGHANLPGVEVVWTCRGANPQVCVHPAVDSALPAVQAAVAPVALRLANTPFAIHRAEQRPRGVGSQPSPSAVAFALDDTTPAAVRRAGQELAVNALGDGDTCFTSTGPASGYDLAQLVGAWATGQPGLYRPATPADTAAQRWFTHLTTTARRAWLAAHATDIRRCTLDRRAFR